jgi:hypothetical protein
MSVHFGYSDQLIYDEDTYNDKLKESISPMIYKLNPDQNVSKQACLSLFGPRPSKYGMGVSTVTNCISLPNAELTDLESILSNRNVRNSKSKMACVNDIDISKFKLFDVQTCDNYLNAEASRLNMPPSTYRGLSINRFYDLTRNPQANIYWNHATNTTLEAKDNFKVHIPSPKDRDATLPEELFGKPIINNCNYASNYCG